MPEDIEAEMERLLKGTEEKRPEPSDLLSTGSSVLNKAVSGKTTGGLRKGKYYLLVGDTNTGKTALTMTIFAEAAHNPSFDGYELLHINPEQGATENVAKHFGETTADRIEETVPTTLEEFYDYLDKKNESGLPFVAVTDSMDALVPAAVLKRHKKGRTAREKGDEEAGSFNTEKSRINSDRLRSVVVNLKKTGSILIIISQTRDRIGFGSQYDPKTFSGGNALTFYARLQIWTKLGRNIKRRIKGIDREVGKDIKVRIKKNHLTGWEGNLTIRLYKLLVDDVGGMVLWLIEEGHWKEQRAKTAPVGTGKVSAPEFKFGGSVEKLVQQIEAKGQEGKLRKLVSKVWVQIEKESAPKRKRRYK